MNTRGRHINPGTKSPGTRANKSTPEWITRVTLIVPLVLLTPLADAQVHQQDPLRILDAEESPQDRRPYQAPRGLWNRLTPEEKQDVMAFMKEHFPEVFEQIQRNRDRDNRVRPWLRRHLGGFIELMEVMEEDPKRGQLMIRERRLEMQMTRLASRYGFADSRNQKQKIEKRMHNLAGQWFDVRLELRAQMISQLEHRLATLRERHDRVKNQRNAFVEKEVQRRLDGAEDVQAIPRRRP